MVRKATLGSVEFVLASWLEPSERYQRAYEPVRPSDRFIPGQQFEFTADLEFRDWVIDDFSGGLSPSPWWSPNDAAVRNAFWFFADDGGLRLGAEPEITQIEAAGGNKTAQFLTIAEQDLYAGLTSNGTVVDWKDIEWEATGVTVGTGASDDMTSGASPGSDTLYITNDNVKDIHKVTGLKGTPGNTTHYAAAAGDPFAELPLVVAFDSRVFALDGNDLYEIDQTSTDTRTQVADVATTYTRIILSEADSSKRLSVSDVGPIWWVQAPDGHTYIYEYNVGSDTQRIVGRIPYPAARPCQLYWALGFFFLSFVDFVTADGNLTSGRGYIFYKRGGQEGTIGPIPSNVGAVSPDPYLTQSIFQFAAGNWPLIAGIIDDGLVVVFGKNVFVYNFSNAAWGMMSHLRAGVLSASVSSAVVYAGELFVSNIVGGTVLRIEPRKTLIDETAGSLAEPHFTTGRWHFGYPNVEKVFTTVAIDTNDLDALDEITLSYSVDGGSFTNHTTVFGGGASTFEWTLSSSSGGTVSGKDLDLRFTVTDRSTDDEDPLRVYRVRVRSQSAQVRRAWTVAADVNSIRSAAGTDKPGWELIDELEVAAAAGTVVAWGDPFTNREEDAADSYDVIIDSIIITDIDDESAHDQQAVLLSFKEMGLA